MVLGNEKFFDEELRTILGIIAYRNLEPTHQMLNKWAPTSLYQMELDWYWSARKPTTADKGITYLMPHKWRLANVYLIMSRASTYMPNDFYC